MNIRAHFQRLVERARLLPPLPAAFVYPCDAESLRLALAAAFMGHLAPTLVGPEKRIRDTAVRAGIDLMNLPVIDTADDPRVAGAFAAQLARAGSAGTLIKGNLGNEDLLSPVAAPDSGLRGERRLSHAYFVDMPQHPRGLLLADAQINIVPGLAAKKDIVRNTLELAAAIGMKAPKVAIVAAMDVVNPAFSATADAAALKAMAAQGMFPGAVIEGPLAMDAALASDGAAVHTSAPHFADADVLIAPGMEAALMVLRTMLALTGGIAAGLVLGASVPIVAPARTDSLEMRMASCVLAVLLAAAMAAARHGKDAAVQAAETAAAS